MNDSGIVVSVSDLEHKKMMVALSNKKGLEITLTRTQVGGFLPVLMSVLGPMVMPALGALATGAATAVGSYATTKLLKKIGGDGMTLLGSENRGKGMVLLGKGHPTKPKLVKGSVEARDHMARLREMRKKKST